MNDDRNFASLIRQGFRITVGATTAVVETLQNPQKRTEAIDRLQIELEQKTQEWAVKGETTEREAKNFVDNLLSKQGWKQNTDTQSSSQTTTTNNEITVNSSLQELTEEIIALKKELEQLRKSENSR